MSKLSVSKAVRASLSAVPQGLTRWQEQRLRARLRRASPSEAWVDDQIGTQVFTGADGEPVVRRFHDVRVFPPGGRSGTRMRWCRACGRYTPSPAVSLVERRLARDGPVVSALLVCDDCRIGDDGDRYAELYAAGLHLRPSGGRSVVSMHALTAERRRAE